MPAKVKVKIIAGKNLPVMDRSSDTTDAYVELKLGGTTYKTEVCRKSLNPQWNSDWYRFEMDDSELQDEPLQIRLMDHDTYSANDAIGKVYVDLNPLLLPSIPVMPKCRWSGDPSSNGEHSTNSLLSGWFPVYDTMHGIRGEVNVMVKVELFSDFNKFRQSSCGVQFFCSPSVPHGYAIQMYHGFVEELIVNDDPEYQWIDKIRTPRASNEARQTLFFKLAGELRRRIGVKALELGGNAVIGYSQCFDLEGELGVVVRGIGTSVTLTKLRDVPPLTILESNNEETIISPGTELSKCDSGHHRTESVSGKISQSPGKFQSIPFMNRRSSDSDLSITPKGNSLTGSDKSSGLHNAYISRIAPMVHTSIPQNNFDMLEYPFMTIYKFPPGFVMYLGGVVSARSVKLLERITNLEEPESRDTWWTELRMEIRSHMRSLHCNAVLAYSETSSISDDVCVLSASGTAAVIRFYSPEEMAEGLSSLPGGSRHTSGNKDVMASSLERNDFERERIHQKQDLGFNSKPLPESPENETVPNHTSINTISPCSICHLPYINNSVPLRTISSKCAFCRFGKVPDVLMATIEIPESVPSVGRGCFVQAYVCRPLKDLRSELNAKDISDGLPFLEYELHRILVNKIRIKGMNAVFGLRIRISVGTKMLVGIATGTAMFLLPLPSPPLPKLVSIGSIDEKQLTKMQQHLYDTIQANKEIYHLKTNEHLLNSRLSPDDEHPQEEEQSFLDLSTENRDCCILEVEDSEDKEIMELLREPPPPDGFHVINTEVIPGLDEMEVIKNLQMFTQIWRSKIYPSYNFGLHISKLLQSVYFKLRRMVPCALCNLKFRIDLPEPDEIQLTVLGMALELRKSVKPRKKNIHTSLRESTQITTEEDMMFNLEEDPADCNSLSVQPAKSRTRSPFRSAPIASNVALPREKRSIDITQLSYVPGGKIERYLGNLNFFFIRETTSIREEGGLSGFIHTFVTEVLAIVRAHIAALGGNAMVAYYMTECDFSHSVHKNQGQCLINVGGDVVFVSYYAEK
uniref:C2 domain-containing protein n=1 Tax=Photinus pyralis TaxID=7054 RepID=A0A1Y1LNM9_PHOPY